MSRRSRPAVAHRSKNAGQDQASTAESATNLRYQCVRVMVDLHNAGGSLSRLLPVAQSRVAATEQAQLQAWCFGMCRWSHQLFALVSQLLDKPLKARDQDVYVLMQLGVFQLMHTGVAVHAAVDETVKVTRKLKKPWAKSLVNAVLRNFTRRRSALEASLDEAARYSHPNWLLNQIRADWPDDWPQVLDAGNQQGPMTLRVNSARSQVSEYAARLDDAGLPAQRLPSAPDALTLDVPVGVSVLPGFEQGDVSVQDAAAQLAAHQLIHWVPEGGSVLDACAAPGGKAAHLLEKAHFSSVLALDKDADRVERMRLGFKRLGLENKVRIKTVDALQVQQWWDGQGFAAILLDAPCSGTGVIRRHPDIKLLRRETDIQTLVQLQSELMDALWQTLLPDGVMLYATCSVLLEENAHQVSRFLQRTTDARLAGAVRQILPGDNRMDGFFYAPLRKITQP